MTNENWIVSKSLSETPTYVGHSLRLIGIFSSLLVFYRRIIHIPECSYGTAQTLSVHRMKKVHMTDQTIFSNSVGTAKFVIKYQYTGFPSQSKVAWEYIFRTGMYDKTLSTTIRKRSDVPILFHTWCRVSNTNTAATFDMYQWRCADENAEVRTRALMYHMSFG
jgi:hypothetical protein